MAFYLIQASYKEEQVKALITNPQDRTQAARQVIEGLGGKLHHFFYAFGDYDIVGIVEMPKNVNMAAVSLAVSGAGPTSAFKTTALITADEALEAMKLAGTTATGYKPPSG